MRLLLLAYLTMTTTFAHTLNEQCQTPIGQRGKCVPLASCQPLLWSFANPKDGSAYLEKFQCSNNTDEGIIVCCRIVTDALVFEDEEDTYDANSIYNIKELTNVNTCGIQSGYVQGDGLIGLYDFPWLVKIMNQNKYLDEKDQISKVSCTGVLISPRYILYSTQCHKTVIQIEPNFSVRIELYTGYGSNCDTVVSSYNRSCSTFGNYEIEDYYLHRFYDPKTKLNDIAIMRLSRRITFSEFLQPICLPLNLDASKFTSLYTSGWNRTFLSNDSSVKTTYVSSLISNSDCKKFKKVDDVVTTFDMCTINGNPMNDEVIGYPVMSFRNNRWYLQGFTSRGKEPRIHTRIQNYLQWIKENMGGERCLTPLNETGECIQLTECPRLLHAFNNPRPEDEDYLNEFICKYDDDDEDDAGYTLKVCCGNSDNFTIFESRTNEEPIPYDLSNYRICGLQHRDDYFSNTENVSVDEFPWLAAIINATLPSQRDGICGGSLINDRYVLSSAVCVDYFGTDDVLLVRLGDYNLKTDVDCFELPEYDILECADVQEHKVNKSIVHPFFNFFQDLNNIALLRLDKTVKFSDYVRPICLPSTEDDIKLFGNTLYTSGFGDNEEGIEGNKTKKKIPTTLITLSECNEKGLLQEYANPFTDYLFCSEDFRNSTDVTCDGDEGGPVMLSKKFQWYIEGVSSTFACRNNGPQIHTKVFKYLKWIKLTIDSF